MARTEKVVTYTLRFAGLFGRNRNPKNGHRDLAEVPEGQPLAEDEVQRLTDEAIAEIKPKPTVEFRYQVVMCPETVEYRDNGIIVRSFQIASGCTVLKGTRPASL